MGQSRVRNATLMYVAKVRIDGTQTATKSRSSC
jgi:hypothetical protein